MISNNEGKNELTFEEEVKRAPSIVTAKNIQRTPWGISAEVTFTDTPDGEQAFGYNFNPDDCTPRGVRGYQDIVSGKYGAIGEYTKEMEKKDKEVSLKIELRNLITVANAVCQPLSEEKELGIISDEDLEKYKKWALYRQSLRKLDLSAENIEWPEKPE